MPNEGHKLTKNEPSDRTFTKIALTNSLGDEFDAGIVVGADELDLHEGVGGAAARLAQVARADDAQLQRHWTHLGTNVRSGV